jgi:hypothetical protein
MAPFIRQEGLFFNSHPATHVSSIMTLRFNRSKITPVSPPGIVHSMMVKNISSVRTSSKQPGLNPVMQDLPDLLLVGVKYTSSCWRTKKITPESWTAFLVFVHRSHRHNDPHSGFFT